MLTDTTTPKNQNSYKTDNVNYKLTNAYKQSKHSPEDLPQLPDNWQDNATPLDYYLDYSEQVNNDPDELTEKRKTRDYRNALKAGKKYLARKKLNKKAYFLVNNEYALESLLVAVDLGITSIKIKSDMGSGKSYAVRWLLKYHPEINSVLVLTALASLNRSAINSAIKHGLDGVVYNDMIIDDKHEIISSTFNSLPKVVQKRGSRQFDLILIDESEQCAGFMTSGNKTIKNLAEAGNELARICKESGIVLLADAHMGADSHAFAERYCGDRDFCQIFNNYKVRDDYTYSVGHAYDEGIGRVQYLLAQGKNVFMTFTSGELAHQTIRMLKDTGATAELEVIEVSKHTKLEDKSKEALGEPDNFKLYNLSAISPIAGTGISIEGEHFHETVAFITRDFGRTPNSKSAMQLLDRARHLIDKHITIITIDNKFSGEKIDDFNAVNEKVDLILDLHSNIRNQVLNGNADKETIELYNRNLESQLLYDAQIEKNNIADYWNFWENIALELANKGMQYVVNDSGGASFDTKEGRREARQNIYNDKKEAFTKADYVDDVAYKKLIISDKYNPEMMSTDQSLELKKRIVVDKFIPLDPESAVTEEQSEKAYDLYMDGYGRALNNIHLSQLTKRETKKILNADINGIGEYLDHKLDKFNTSSTKRESEYAILKPLATIIGLKKDDGGAWSIKHDVLDDTLCRSEQGHRNQLLLLKKSIKMYNVFHQGEHLSLKNLKDNPAVFVRDLLSTKFKISFRKVRGKNKFSLGNDQEIIELLNSGIDNNRFEKKLVEIERAVQRDKDRTLQAEVELLIDTKVTPTLKKLPNDNKLHLITQLMRIPSNMREGALVKYLNISQEKERQNNRFSQLAWAHKMLKIDADFYDK